MALNSSNTENVNVTQILGPQPKRSKPSPEIPVAQILGPPPERYKHSPKIPAAEILGPKPIRYNYAPEIPVTEILGPKPLQYTHSSKTPVAQLFLQDDQKPEIKMEIEEIPLNSETENILATEKNNIILEEVATVKLEHTENNIVMEKFEIDEIACINCEQYFSDEFELINHIQETDKCQNAVRLIGLKYCLVCQKVVHF
jgi:hypothetical protein